MIPDTSQRLSKVLLSPEATISEAIRRLDEAGTGALLLSRDGVKLAGLVTDGDVRRAFLRGESFDRPCSAIATREPIFVRSTQPAAEAAQRMKDYDINHLPVLAPDDSLAGLLMRADLLPGQQLGASAVIMAGGYGTRLLPLTRETPKSMLPVGDRPLLELTIRRLRQAGIHRVHVTTHHLAERITGHFGDGSDFGVALSYVPEDNPLGTAGSLRTMDLDEPLLVINGDIITAVPFQNIIAYHREQGADVTIGVRKYEVEVPYGVVQCQGPYVRQVEEKPKLSFLVNAGIYVLEPSVRRFIPARRFDMTDLIDCLLRAGRPVVSFPIVEYWLDIGRKADYDRAQEDFKNGMVTV